LILFFCHFYCVNFNVFDTLAGAKVIEYINMKKQKGNIFCFSGIFETYFGVL
jgi:hypothetical protein